MVKLLDENIIDHEQGCLICGAPLIYSETTYKSNCDLCGEEFDTNSECENKHFVCNECHSKDAYAVIKTFCERTQLDDPIQIMEEIFKYPQIKLHGPEHHFLVPTAIVTALKNSGYDVDPKYLEEIEARAKDIPGGACGFWGACGAAIGVGIAFSVFFKANPKKKVERGYAIIATSLALSYIGDGNEQCCKRESRTTIESACKILKDEHGIELPCANNVHCTFSSMNDRCNKDLCEYFGC